MIYDRDAFVNSKLNSYPSPIFSETCCFAMASRPAAPAELTGVD